VRKGESSEGGSSIPLPEKALMTYSRRVTVFKVFTAFYRSVFPFTVHCSPFTAEESRVIPWDSDGSHVIPQHHFQWMRIKIHLPFQIRLIVLHDVVPEQGKGHNERDPAGFINLDLV